MIWRVIPLAAAVLAVAGSSCSRIERLAGPKPGANSPDALRVPAFLRAGGRSGNSGVRVTLDDSSELSGEVTDRIKEREEDLMWTDPDNPEKSMEGMEEVMVDKGREGPWFVSYSKARRAAMRSGKPILVWFTDTQFSPLCRSLDSEVFSKGAFSEWAKGAIVRLRLDFNVKGVSGGQGQSAMDDKIRKENYLEELKRRYKVQGFPTVLLLTPDGKVAARYRGYRKSYFDFYEGRLRNDTGKAVDLHGEWRQSMAGRGYREWTDQEGRKVFAKLTRYKSGQLILVEPDGRNIRAKESRLSDGDRAWIASERAKRDN